jgi:hypothetical protein
LRRRAPAAIVLLVGLALVPVYSIRPAADITLFARILIFAIAALGLNPILGYGAMVSFGHALYPGRRLRGRNAVVRARMAGCICSRWSSALSSRCSSAGCACAPPASPSS